MSTRNLDTRAIWMATMAIAALHFVALGVRTAAAGPSKCPEEVVTCDPQTTSQCSIPGHGLCNICFPILLNPSEGTCISYN